MEWSKLNAKCLKLDTESQSETPQEFPNTTELSPMDRVILLPELSAKILGYCVANSDLKTLLNLRLVCPVWKRCAFSEILKFIDELPTIVAGSEKFLMETKLRRSQNVNWRSLESFHRTFTSSCELPIKLAVNTVWNKSIVKVFERFAYNVVSIHHNYDTGNCYIPKEIFKYTCPSLKHVTFSNFKAGEKERKKFITLLELIKHFIDNTSNELTSFEEELRPYFMNHFTIQGSWPIEDAACELLPQDKITRLTCKLPFFLQITKNHSMKNLKTAHIYDVKDRSRDDSPMKIPFLQDRGENLIELEIRGLDNQYQLGEMKNLQVLKVQAHRLVTFEAGISTLLPSLRKLEVEGESRMISVFLERKNVFHKVDEIKIFHQGNLAPFDGVDIFVPLALRFPNLTMLNYECMESNLGRLATVTHTIFNKLQRLSVLKLKMDIRSVQDLFLLLINTRPCDIPKERAAWRTDLIRSRNGIWKMQNMKIFRLQTFSRPNKRFVVRRLESEFLFTTAFGLIESLQSLNIFNGISFHKDSISSWRSSGRLYTYHPHPIR